MKPLAGKIALVTGAARGIGRGIALVLAEQGATIALNDLPGDAHRAAAAEVVAAAGGTGEYFPADVTDESQVAGLFAAVHARYGRLDILVNNAGTSQPKDIFAATLEDWNRIMTTNLTSCFLCSKAVMEIMAGQKSGRIVNISSVVAEQGALFGHVHYAASKSGMIGFTKTLARTAAPLGITVNAIAPGIIGTELLENTHGAATTARLAQDVPLGLGTVRDVGLAVAFLCGEGGRYITGSTLDVNGGLYLR
jgi:NAD(P)-dependent dehydrogenase (short-subunit alcohol dehydrogenase family)